ncbi:MAG: tetratricopeptide repeat protein [Burkholderiales bacterium]|nr:MAG: tetratricopeptide repeat protein [Burkholderiales bacterium]CAG1009166.1 Chemotaxis protein CheY [Myxococcaceae bacterium]
MEDFSSLSALIIESHVGMRGNLRGMLNDCGITQIQYAGTANGAIRKLKERFFDLVLCEYHFNEGQDGQHFLEDARHHNLLPLSTIFFMVTSESSYERVVSAAELAPSDYLLKPFAAETMFDRIFRALRKREAFLPAYRRMEKGEVREAVAYCQEGKARFPQYAVDFLRLAAELHVALGEPEQAQEIYKQVLELKAVPWARLGLARTLFMQKEFDEAEELLEGLINESKNYLDAYDWLAQTKEANGKVDGALDVLADAVTVSPHVVRRLRKLGEMAIDAGDHQTAEKVLSEVVHQGKYSEFRNPEDHVKLVQALVGQGNVEGAGKVIRDLDRSMRGLETTDACTALSQALVYTKTGDTGAAAEALAKAVEASRGKTELSDSLKMELARNCLAQNMENEASDVICEVMRNAPDEVAIAKAKAIFAAAGRGHLAEQLAENIRREVVDLISTGAEKARSGDYEGAVSLMLEAAKKMPSNTQVAFNAALAIVKCLENKGWDDNLADQGRRFIERVRSLDPRNARLPALADYYQVVLQKYGMTGFT